MSSIRTAALVLAAALTAAGAPTGPAGADAPVAQHGPDRAAAPSAASPPVPAEWLEPGGPRPDHAARAYPQYAQQQPGSPIRFLKVATLARRLQAGEHLTIIDVRTREEYEAHRLPGAINVPLADVEQRLEEIPRKGTVVLY